MKSLFNKIAILKACNFNKKRTQHRCFPVKFDRIIQSTSGGCFWNINQIISVDGFSSLTSVSDACSTLMNLLHYENKIIEILVVITFWSWIHFVWNGISQSYMKKAILCEDFFSIDVHLFLHKCLCFDYVPHFLLTSR